MTLDELRRQLADLADSVPPPGADTRRAVRRRYRRRRLARGGAAVTTLAALGMAVALAVNAGHAGQTVHVETPAHTGGQNGGATVGSSSNPTVTLPPGVIARSAILARYPPPRPGITVHAKLVTVASLAQVDPGLTQCPVRGCAPGQYVWLVLEQGPPGSFPHSGPAGVTLPAGADAWTLFPVNAVTGAARGDREIGSDSQLASSAWAKLSDLDS